MWRFLIFCAGSILSQEVAAESLDLASVVSGNRQGSAPLGLALGDGVLDVEGVCSKIGAACLNCSHAVTCVQLPSGWLRVPLETCDGDRSCNAALGGCSRASVPECRRHTAEFQHVCEQVGVFPDAFDCRKFHMCSPPPLAPHGRPAEHHVAYCPRHYAYDPLTAQCKIKLRHGQCESTPVPECNYIGQSDSIPGSPNHYYVCLTKRSQLYPQVFVCPYGYYFYNNFCNSEPSPVKDADNSNDGSNRMGANNRTDDNHRSNDSNRTYADNMDNDSVKKILGIDKITDVDKTETTENPKIRDTTTEENYLKRLFGENSFLADKFDLIDYQNMPESIAEEILQHHSGSEELDSVESY